MKSALLLAYLMSSTALASTPVGFKLRPGDPFPESLGNRHFFRAESSYGLLPKLRPEAAAHSFATKDCRAKIRQIVCLVEPAKGEEARECLPGGEAYAAPFEELHDHFPPALQKVFCSLNVIYIEKGLVGTAYAGTLDTGGALIGVRQSVLDEKLSLPDWASWKEQLSFGGRDDSYIWEPSRPWVEANNTLADRGFLYFVLAHEFGHILDMANGLNNFCQEEECERAPNTWGAISWRTNLKPKEENEFPHRTGLCFYWCSGNPLSKRLAPQVYQDLSRTDFISTYATTQPWDDFADSLAYFLLHRQLGASYLLHTGQGETYDMMAKLESPLFAKKLRFLEEFLERKNIRYP